MKERPVPRLLRRLIAVSVVLLGGATSVRAHCDGMDGPVVSSAQKALTEGNVNLVLIWVQKEDEPEIKAAFQKTLAVRKLNAAARELADLYFFETLVRIHRAGEGAPYTGLKPAGRDLGPAIPAADKSLETAKVEPIVKPLAEKMEEGVGEHFKAALAKKQFAKDKVEVGRGFVKAYVEYVHYVEGIYEKITTETHGHSHVAKQTNGHRDAP